MKNKHISFLLLLVLLVMPLQAKSSYRLILNGLTFEPTYTPIVYQKHLFLALSDLADMTYSHYTSLDDHQYLWTIAQTDLTLISKNKCVKVNELQRTQQVAPFMLGDVLYVPVDYLDLAKYPYTLSSDLKQLELTALLPTSTLLDATSTHATLPTHYTNWEQIFSTESQKEVSALIQTATTSKQYLSFASTAYKQEILTAFNTMLETLPTLEVTFRNLDLLDAKPNCSKLSRYPLKITSEASGLVLAFNNQQIHYQCLWPTFNPSTSNTAIDINKSLDVTIMRALYENYRDTYDLKDDIHFSPITTVSVGASESITYTVYSDHLLDQTHTYTVTISKYMTKDKINYIVDLASHPILP